MIPAGIMGKSEKNHDRHFEKQTACFFSRKLLRAFHFPRCPPLRYDILCSGA
jgi:hypothetical protein